MWKLEFVCASVLMSGVGSNLREAYTGRQILSGLVTVEIKAGFLQLDGVDLTEPQDELALSCTLLLTSD